LENLNQRVDTKQRINPYCPYQFFFDVQLTAMVGYYIVLAHYVKSKPGHRFRQIRSLLVQSRRHEKGRYPTDVGYIPGT
jgi:hypothetical protein